MFNPPFSWHKSDMNDVYDTTMGGLIDRPVVMVGMMASGKTRLGRDLARVLKLDFMDTDLMVEHHAGASISQIFENEGETVFRNLESQMIEEVLGHNPGPCVISTGGGAVVRPENAALIFGDTVSVWTRATIPLILSRTAQREDRPLLKNADPEKVLRDMAAVRYPLYGKANITIDVDDRWPNELVDEMIAKIKKELRP